MKAAVVNSLTQKNTVKHNNRLIVDKHNFNGKNSVSLKPIRSNSHSFNRNSHESN